MLGALDEAIELLTFQSSLNPSNPRPLYNRSAVHSRKGNVEAAVRDLEHAIKISPEYRKKAKLDPDFAGMFSDSRFVALTSE